MTLHELKYLIGSYIDTYVRVNTQNRILTTWASLHQLKYLIGSHIDIYVSVNTQNRINILNYLSQFDLDSGFGA